MNPLLVPKQKVFSHADRLLARGQDASAEALVEQWCGGAAEPGELAERRAQASRFFADRGRGAPALHHLRAAAAVGADDVLTRYRATVALASHLNGIGAHREALAEAERAAELEPRGLEAIRERGIAYLGLGQPLEAWREFSLALCAQHRDTESLPFFEQLVERHGGVLRGVCPDFDERVRLCRQGTRPTPMVERRGQEAHEFYGEECHQSRGW